MEEKKNDKTFTINKVTDEVSIMELDSFIKHDKPVPGVYNLVVIKSMFGEMTRITKTDVALPKNAEHTSNAIIDPKDLTNLLSKEYARIHAALGSTNKLGYLLYGPQGTGKTTAMLAVGKTLVETHGAVVFLVDDLPSLEGAYKTLKTWREFTPDLLGVMLFDECEHEMEHYETQMKKILDGVHSVSNTIFIGSTNYIDQIPDTIKDRPSRIKRTIDCADLNSGEEVIFGHLNRMNESLEKVDQLKDSVLRDITKCLIDTEKQHSIDELKNEFLDAVLGSLVANEEGKTSKLAKTRLVEAKELT